MQFFEYKLASIDDAEEDAALWDAVQFNHRYQAEHPDEPVEEYETPEALAQALAEL